MSVLIETSKGDLIFDLFVEDCPKASTNFLKLCKVKYYNNCLFYNVQHNFIVQSGDPTNTGRGGESVWGLLYGEQARFFEDEIRPHLKHKKRGLLCMAGAGEAMNASQFYITVGEGLASLDEKHTVFGELAEGWEASAACLIRHTILLDDPFPDPPTLAEHIPDASPAPQASVIRASVALRIAPPFIFPWSRRRGFLPQYADDGRLEDDWVPDQDARAPEEIEKANRQAGALARGAGVQSEARRRLLLATRRLRACPRREKEAHNRAVVLEMIGDLPEADAKPPPNMLFICKLNPVTTEEDLEIIFSRFGAVTSCDVIRDWKTGDSLNYGFIGFDSEEACEQAYFKMNNVLIDDRRIKVDFSQSVHHLWKQFHRFGRRGNADLRQEADDAHLRQQPGGQAGPSGRFELKDKHRPGLRGHAGYDLVQPKQLAGVRGARLPARVVRVAASAGDAKPVLAAAGAPEEKKFLGIPAFTWSKIIPLGVMFFCILFNYTILRDTKDVLVVTAPGSGAEIIPFLKTWVNLPMAIGFTVLYTKLSNVLSTESLFYACIKLLEQAGPRFAGPIAILRNWTYCLFYVMAELWGSVVVSVLFWGFANQITTVDEAKQFYPLFGLGANVALIFSGRAVKMFSQLRANLPPGVDGWGMSLKGMMSMVVGFGLLITLVFWYLNRTVGAIPKREKKKKEPMSVGESFTFLAKSPYIRDLAFLVVAYGISINLVEVTWKSKLKAQFPNPNDYSSFMGDFSTTTGAVTFTMMIISRWIFSKFGWGVAALITPTVLLLTGVVFFSLVLFSGPLEPALATLGLTPLYAAVLVGAAQNIFSKSSKYSLFDPCKEMSYIPLDLETKTKGKAAIDVICNPLGKSGGALIQQIMIIGFGSLAASTPYLAVILLGIVGLWILAARDLDWRFAEAQAAMGKEE
eukprot:scaffold27.g6020.t1